MSENNHDYREIFCRLMSIVYGRDWASAEGVVCKTEDWAALLDDYTGDEIIKAVAEAAKRYATPPSLRLFRGLLEGSAMLPLPLVSIVQREAAMELTGPDLGAWVRSLARVVAEKGESGERLARYQTCSCLECPFARK